MKLVQKFPVLGSSVDPAKLSLTLRGLIPLVVSVAVLFNVQVSETELETYVAAVVAVVSGLVTLYGAGRKAWVYLKKRQK